MKTYSIEHVLRKKLAYVPGSVSNIGRLLMIISLDSSLSTSSINTNNTNNNAISNPNLTADKDAEVDDLAITLNYYAQLFRFNEILEFNILAIVDNRCGNWKRLRSVLKMIKMFLPQVAVALVVKSDHVSTPLNVKLWLNRTRQPARRGSFGAINHLCGVSDTTSLPEISHDNNNNDDNNAMMTASASNMSSVISTSQTGHAIRPSTVLVIGQSKLATYINLDQMPVEFGGRFNSYNHIAWLIARIAAERYVDRVETLIAQRFMDDNERDQKMTQTSCIGEWRVRPFMSESESVDVSQLIDLGRKVISNLKRQPTAKLNIDLIASVQMALTSLEPMTFLQTYSKNNLKTKTKEPKVKLYGANQFDADASLMVPMNRDEIEREMQSIRRWLANDGDRLVMCETEVGTSLRSAERLFDKHEIIELGCAETFARYARLISALDVLSLGPFLDSDLQIQRAELESTLRTFAMRIDRRRTLLLTCARFFRLLKKTTSAIANISNTLSKAGETEDGLFTILTDEQLISVETNRNRAEILGGKTFEEGARLVQMLTVGTGRPDIVRDYSKEIETVVKSSEALRADLDAMERIFAVPDLPPPPDEPIFVENDTNNKPSTDSLNSSGSTSSTSGHHSNSNYESSSPFEQETRSRQNNKVEDDVDPETRHLEELIKDFVQALEQQLITIGDFVNSFSSEASSGSVTDSRDLLKKYQATYNELEHEWSFMNRCGLEFVEQIIKANSNVNPETLSSIENAVLEVNRQFSRVRTLWKDIQINKVQSDIVKLLEVCTRRGGSTWSISNSIPPSNNSPNMNSPNNNNVPDDDVSVSFSNKIYFEAVFPADVSPATNASRQSSGLPSSVSSSPGQNKANIAGKLSPATIAGHCHASPEPPQLLCEEDIEQIAPTKSPSFAIRRCFTSNDLIHYLSPLSEDANNNNHDNAVPSQTSSLNTKWLSDPELHFEI